MNVVIVGSGAVAAEITSYITDQKKFSDPDSQMNLVGYLDSVENIEKYWSKYKLLKPVLADINTYPINGDDHFIVAISDLPYRMKMIRILEERGAKIIGFIHRTSIVAESATLGVGNIIYPFCIIGPNCKIGDHNLVTSYSFISHDCFVGHNNFFSTAGLSGRVIVGNNNFFGIRSTVLPHVTVGSGNTIQAGMTVDKNVADDSIVFHRFKEKVIAINSTQS